MLEAVPENRLGLFGCKSMEPIPAPGGDEINAVVAVPVFESMLAVPMLVMGVA
jgi:hypothetical protein